MDLVCLTETNKDWRKVEQSNTIWNGTINWKETRRVQVGHNTSRPANREFVVGGNAMIAFNDVVYRISEQGCDGRLLGRWSYFTITGKHNLKTTIVTCYCPCKGQSPGSVYSQHLLYMSENKTKYPDTISCPRQLFGYDLRNFLEEKYKKEIS